ncbi:trehalose 6-phosphatase [Devosia lucknowensis]|uniref:Trehalose 6-phosphate phosphatase n=1 Tax=Devosia lucknowensis TaxID=1096929 RepID=A0A1Y6FB00_9HYPH|nr:trehalose-phosphatase [Devosia lucknowensis]SMQ72108.1 trehalose 6-phosphatase [Devosia lucknowensis]
MSEPATNPGAIAPRLAIFTDFDGTLVEIADTPDAVEVSTELTDQLDQASRDFDHAFAVITGREIADIDRFLSPLHLPVAGAHGAQRRRADGTLLELDDEISAAAEAIAEAVQPFLMTHPELILEAKDGAVALHYRQAQQLENECVLVMQEAIADHPGFTLVHGKMVIEARPSGYDKGSALRAFMQEEPFRGRTPIFIGDDTTDEDAFRVAQELGGIGIKLGPGETVARMRIADVASVHALLRGLAEITTRPQAAEELEQEDPILAETTAH